MRIQPLNRGNERPQAHLIIGSSGPGRVRISGVVPTTG